MKQSNYSRHRAKLLAWSVAAVAVFGFLISLPLSDYLIWGLTALPLGLLIGWVQWRGDRGRVDRRNAVILYSTDSVFYILLIVLFVWAAYPRITLKLGWFALGRPVLVDSILWAVTLLWCGHNLAYLWGVRRFESQRGQLQVKRFYSRSVTGGRGDDRPYRGG